MRQRAEAVVLVGKEGRAELARDVGRRLRFDPQEPRAVRDHRVAGCLRVLRREAVAAAAEEHVRPRLGQVVARDVGRVVPVRLMSPERGRRRVGRVGRRDEAGHLPPVAEVLKQRLKLAPVAGVGHADDVVVDLDARRDRRARRGRVGHRVVGRVCRHDALERQALEVEGSGDAGRVHAGGLDLLGPHAVADQQDDVLGRGRDRQLEDDDRENEEPQRLPRRATRTVERTQHTFSSGASAPIEPAHGHVFPPCTRGSAKSTVCDEPVEPRFMGTDFNPCLRNTQGGTAVRADSRPTSSRARYPRCAPSRRGRAAAARSASPRTRRWRSSSRPAARRAPGSSRSAGS